MSQLLKRTVTEQQEELRQLKAAYRRGEIQLNLNPLRLEPDLFSSEQEYEQVVNSVVERIKNGEVKPSEEEEAG
ncbi:hypothetical protein [Hymenobacter weizhouensis]|uniref:hypothetical protein n=1 Tax=Hymenobacter sp. YIM 151500-1 TaxID=2987689 RepID=UPI002227F919|nr:hypothetical protein [Hymenobacter sp. YIM 151500-1]UYZ61437.1 hypothetical protein OIS53_10495 [Hymenobacter sp. YIM 151500-1]